MKVPVVWGRGRARTLQGTSGTQAGNGHQRMVTGHGPHLAGTGVSMGHSSLAAAIPLSSSTQKGALEKGRKEALSAAGPAALSAPPASTC